MKRTNMKAMLLVIVAMMTCNIAKASHWNEEKYKQIESQIKTPEFADRTFDVTKYGAKSDAKAAKNQKAIQKAIDQCSKAGGGKVIVSAGTYLTGALTLKSGVNLVVEKNATLKFAFEPKLYPIVYTRWEGLDCYNYSPCIYSNGAQNIGITGEGTIDGNGSNDTFWQWTGVERFGYKEGVTKETSKFPKKGQTVGSRSRLQQMADNDVSAEQRRFGMGDGLRPQLVNLVNSENILIEGVTMLNSPFWVMHPLFCKNLTVRSVKVINEGPNGDGCDPESCENVLIENCIFHTGDDCIAIKSGRNADGRNDGRASQNIIVRGCTMEDGHGGVVIGSEISAGCNNVFVENCKMDSPNLDRVLRIKTNSCRGGITENVYVRNIEVGQCKEAVVKINLNYWPKENSPRDFNPTVRNIFVENITCQKSDNGIWLEGLTDADNIYNIHIDNCRFNGVTKDAIHRIGKSHDVVLHDVFVNDRLIVENPAYKSWAEWLTFSEMKRVPNSIYLDFTDPKKRPQGRWSYVMGIELEGMLDTYLAHPSEDIMKYLTMYPEQMIREDGSTVGYDYDEFNLDNVRTAHFIYRINKMKPQAGVDKALQTYFRQLINQPRTDEGVYWHKAIYHDQVWLDGIYMGLPYKTMAAPEMVKAGLTAKSKGIASKKKLSAKQQKAELKAYYDDIVDQITMTDARTYDEKTGLWKHAWDSKHGMFWADKETGKSKHTWARAMGWFVMAQIEILDYLPEDYARRSEIIAMLNKSLKACIDYQDPKTGVWYDVMDVNAPRNYLESTASCMFAYAMLKGARLGYLDDSYRQAGIKAYKGIINNFISIKEDNTISLTKCCSVSGLGPESNPKRDGSFEYYMSEPIRENDAKGVGPFLWATLEMERMGYDTASQY